PRSADPPRSARCGDAQRRSGRACREPPAGAGRPAADPVSGSRPPVEERRISVRVATGTTEVVVGAGCLGRLEAAVAAACPRARRTLVFVDEGVRDPRVHGRWAGEWAPGAMAVGVPA